jgi:hypothetical protein
MSHIGSIPGPLASANIQTGSLSLITEDSGTVGWDEASHEYLLPDDEQTSSSRHEHGSWVRKRPSSPERCRPFELGCRSRGACAIWPCSTWRSTSTNGPSSSKEKRTDPFSFSSRTQHGRPSNAGSWKMIYKLRTIFSRAKCLAVHTSRPVSMPVRSIAGSPALVLTRTSTEHTRFVGSKRH